MARSTFLLAALLSLPPAAAPAQVDSPWLGRRVITQFGTELRAGPVVLDAEKRTFDPSASGRERRSFRVYRVERVSGDFLWLKAEKEGVAGWVGTREVIPYEQAIPYLTDQIRLNPDDVLLYIKRANVWQDKGDNDLAIADYNEAIRREPRNEVAWNDRGFAWYSKKQYERAIADCGEAIRLDPTYALARINRGIAWSAKGEYEKAIADLDEAIRIDPKSALSFNDRGMAHASNGEYDKAIADFTEAMRLDPRSAWAFNSRAWLRSTCPEAKYRDGPLAVKTATRACELSHWQSGYTLGTLAAAYAEAGDFAKAVAWQQKANALYTDAEDRRKGLERLALYRRKKPYRMEPTR